MLRTSGSAMTTAVSYRIGYLDWTISDLSRAASRVRLPMRRKPSSSLMPARPGMPLMSTTCSGSASCSFISGIRLCPPASTTASGPCSPSREIASSSVSGAEYSNRGGIIRPSSSPAQSRTRKGRWPKCIPDGVESQTTRLRRQTPTHFLTIGPAVIIALTVWDSG